MRSALVITCIVCSLVMAIGTLIMRSNAVLLGFQIQTQEQELAKLDDAHEELRSQYLHTVLEQISPAAHDAGFVAVDIPTYVRADFSVASIQ